MNDKNVQTNKSFANNGENVNNVSIESQRWSVNTNAELQQRTTRQKGGAEGHFAFSLYYRYK